MRQKCLNEKSAKVEPYVTVFNPGLKTQSGLCEMMIDLLNDAGAGDIILVGENGEEIVPQLDAPFN